MPTDPAQSLPIVKSEEFLPSISHWMIGGWLLIGITVAGGIALAVCFPQFLPAIDRTHPAVQPDGS